MFGSQYEAAGLENRLALPKWHGQESTSSQRAQMGKTYLHWKMVTNTVEIHQQFNNAINIQQNLVFRRD
jgi:hypothetical protein